MSRPGDKEQSTKQRPAQEEARINPEFLGIGKQFVQTHYRRRSIQLEQRQVANRVAFLQKEEDMTQRRLEQKQADLDRLMAVIGRKQADQDRRRQLKEEREAAIAMQREENLKRRHEHQEKLRNAYLSLYDEHKDASDLLRKTFNNHEYLRQLNKKQSLNSKKEKVLAISCEKKDGKRRVDSFFKTRNDSFTEHYKQKISKEREVADQASNQIQNLSEIASSLKLKLDCSTQKLNEVEERYSETYRISANKSAFSVPNSRSFYTKESRLRETKQESNHEPDPKVEKMIEKELSIKRGGDI